MGSFNKSINYIIIYLKKKNYININNEKFLKYLKINIILNFFFFFFFFFFF